MIPYVLGAAGAGVLGGIVAHFWAPGVWARSAIQHFAAGVVIAAVALPAGLAAAAAVDTLMDGAIISAGFSMGEQLGGLLAVALAIELFFLTLSVGAEYHNARTGHLASLATTTGIAVLLVVGAAAASFLLHGASTTTVAVCLAFGAAALIYLIAEELLVESIQAEESLFSTAMLFAGFTTLLALKLLGPG